MYCEYTFLTLNIRLGPFYFEHTALHLSCQPFVLDPESANSNKNSECTWSISSCVLEGSPNMKTFSVLYPEFRLLTSKLFTVPKRSGAVFLYIYPMA